MTLKRWLVRNFPTIIVYLRNNEPISIGNRSHVDGDDVNDVNDVNDVDGDDDDSDGDDGDNDNDDDFSIWTEIDFFEGHWNNKKILEETFFLSVQCLFFSVRKRGRFRTKAAAGWYRVFERFRLESPKAGWKWNFDCSWLNRASKFNLGYGGGLLVSP